MPPTSPSNNNGGTSTTTTFQGTIASVSGQTGTLTLTIQTTIGTASAAVFRPLAGPLTVSVAGTLQVGGVAVTLVGTYDPSTGAVDVSGTGFSFTGMIVGNVLSGTFSSPTGDTGSFSSLNSGSGTVTPYCATVTDSHGNPGNLTIQALPSGALSGVYTGKGSATVTGQVNGTGFTFTGSDGTTGSGTIQNGAITGSFSSPNGVSGTFSGSTAACGSLPAPPPPGGTIPAGTWSYTLQAQIPLSGSSCSATSTGTAVVSSSGAFTLSYSASCNSCTMSGNASGTIASSGVSGSISASESSNPACTSRVVGGSVVYGGPQVPDPAPANGICKTSTTCGLNSVTTASFGANFSLTFP